jgi:SAM-dependent methyltransferase
VAGSADVSADVSAQQDWTAVFAEVLSQPESRVQAEIWGQVFGEEYPAELAPYSYTSRSELRRIAEEVRVGAGELLVDIGSGRGGPGLWVAATTGADYCAVDIAEPGLAEVRRRAAALGLDGRARTALGSFEALPLEAGEAAAVMSIDALLFTPDKQAAAHELARVLRPGGRLVLTNWDYCRQLAGRPPQVADHRPVLQDAGFRVQAYEETPDWERRHRETDRLLLARIDELAAETGEHPDDVRAAFTEMASTVDAMLRRVLVVAERTP